MATLAPDLDYPAATVTVLSPVRTFREKATLVHLECHRRRLANHPERLSRHWFDLTRLAAHDIGRAALADRELLEDVVRHKKVFSTPVTPTTINASPAGCGSSPTTTSFPACKPITTRCAPPRSSPHPGSSSLRFKQLALDADLKNVQLLRRALEAYERAQRAG